MMSFNSQAQMFSLFTRKAAPDEDTPLKDLQLPITILQSREKAIIREDRVDLKHRSFGLDIYRDTIKDVRHMIDSLLAAERAGWGSKKMDG